jgi:hypothetical protein
LVVVPRRQWRPYAAPAALLLAVTVAVALARPALRHGHPAKSPPPPRHHVAAKHRPPPQRVRRVYVVRAGDTLVSIAARTHVPLPELQRLNPNVAPTALHIGDRLNLTRR